MALRRQDASDDELSEPEEHDFTDSDLSDHEHADIPKSTPDTLKELVKATEKLQLPSQAEDAAFLPNGEAGGTSQETAQAAEIPSVSLVDAHEEGEMDPEAALDPEGEEVNYEDEDVDIAAAEGEESEEDYQDEGDAEGSNKSAGSEVDLSALPAGKTAELAVVPLPDKSEQRAQTVPVGKFWMHDDRIDEDANNRRATGPTQKLWDPIGDDVWKHDKFDIPTDEDDYEGFARTRSRGRGRGRGRERGYGRGPRDGPHSNQENNYHQGPQGYHIESSSRQHPGNYEQWPEPSSQDQNYGSSRQAGAGHSGDFPAPPPGYEDVAPSGQQGVATAPGYDGEWPSLGSNQNQGTQNQGRQGPSVRQQGWDSGQQGHADAGGWGSAEPAHQGNQWPSPKRDNAGWGSRQADVRQFVEASRAGENAWPKAQQGGQWPSDEGQAQPVAEAGADSLRANGYGWPAAQQGALWQDEPSSHPQHGKAGYQRAQYTAQNQQYQPGSQTIRGPQGQGNNWPDAQQDTTGWGASEDKGYGWQEAPAWQESPPRQPQTGRTGQQQGQSQGHAQDKTSQWEQRQSGYARPNRQAATQEVRGTSRGFQESSHESAWASNDSQRQGWAQVPPSQNGNWAAVEDSSLQQKAWGSADESPQREWGWDAESQGRQPEPFSNSQQQQGFGRKERVTESGSQQQGRSSQLNYKASEWTGTATIPASQQQQNGLDAGAPPFVPPGYEGIAPNEAQARQWPGSQQPPSQSPPRPNATYRTYQPATTDHVNYQSQEWPAPGEAAFVAGPMQQAAHGSGGQGHFVQARRPVTIAAPHDQHASLPPSDRAGRRYSSMNAQRWE